MGKRGCQARNRRNYDGVECMERGGAGLVESRGKWWRSDGKWRGCDGERGMEWRYGWGVVKHMEGRRQREKKRGRENV